MAYSVVQGLCVILLIGSGLYLSLLGMIAAVPTLQTHVFYLHRVTLTWFKDLNIPEQFGFAPRQVAAFSIEKTRTQFLHAWHILPLGVYRRNKGSLLADSEPVQTSLNLLRTDPEARLVLYFHGTAGCIASGWRPDSYRAISAAAPDNIHVLAFDYSGYGISSGTPSETELINDGITIVEWALRKAQIPPDRIVIFGQSLGTAVALAVMEHYAVLLEPVNFAGHVLTASFSDVATLLSTYRIGGMIPVLSPLRHVPPLLQFFTTFLQSTWISKDRIMRFIRLQENSSQSRPYYINFIHAEDDTDISCEHSNVLFWHAVSASGNGNSSYETFKNEKSLSRKDLENGGWVAEHKTNKGLIRQTMLRFGVHDKLMSYSITSLAVLDAFQVADPDFLT